MTDGLEDLRDWYFGCCEEAELRVDVLREGYFWGVAAAALRGEALPKPPTAEIRSVCDQAVAEIHSRFLGGT